MPIRPALCRRQPTRNSRLLRSASYSKRKTVLLSEEVIMLDTSGVLRSVCTADANLIVSHSMVSSLDQTGINSTTELATGAVFP
jgi:hypothetical protein